MPQFRIITREDADKIGTDEEQVLVEQRPGHYPEFEKFLRKEMLRFGGNIFFLGRTGSAYRVGFLDGANSLRLKGLEICIRLYDRGQTIAQDQVEEDIWDFLEWLVEKVGEGWTVAGLRETGTIYKVPGAPVRT